MDLEKLLIDYRAAKAKADSVARKIRREEKISEHLNCESEANMEKLWAKFQQWTTIAQDLLSQVKEHKSEFDSAEEQIIW